MRGDVAAPQILTDAAGSHFTRGWKLVEVDVPLEPAFTLYAYVGDWIVIGLTVAGCVAGWRMRKRVSCC
jgi:apolipoprotein N-acyltransferase